LAQKTTRRCLFSFNHQRVDTLCPKGRTPSVVTPALPHKKQRPTEVGLSL
jgi:hypothetical protein